MKLLTTCAAAALMIAAAPALAADRITVSLDASDMQNLLLGLNGLDGYHRVIKNAQGQEQDVLVAYDVAAAGRVIIAHDEVAIQAAFADYRQAKSGVTDPAKVADILAVKRDLALETFDVGALKLDANPIPASVLAAIGFVCPTCVGQDAPPPPAKQ